MQESNGNLDSYGAQTLAQPSSTLSSRYLKERLCCPRVWTCLLYPSFLKRFWFYTTSKKC